MKIHTAGDGQGHPGIAEVDALDAHVRIDQAGGRRAGREDRLITIAQGHRIARPVLWGRCPGVSVGTDLGMLNYTGTITPTPDGVYRLGGGNTVFRGSGNQGFVANLTGGVDTVIMQGMARITNSTCTGNMIITNNGVLHLTTDAAFGVVPASPTNNIQLDTGGAIRLGNGSVTLNANRGITVGSGGGEIHAWSGWILTAPGNLSGAGKLIFTDGGATVFSGTNSAYSGILDIQAGSTIIGNGTTFSWNTTAKVTGVGGANSRYGINANADLAWTTDLGAALGSADAARNNFSLLKRGNGTLTVDVAQSYLQDTDIEGGTVKVANGAAIPSGIGKGNVDFANNAVLDVNGYNIIVNGLTGVGRVIDSASAATQIIVGTNNNTWTLAAQITNALTIIKTGTGTMTTSHRLQVTSNVLHVTAGTLAVPAATLIDRSLTLSGTGSTLALNTGNAVGASGLTAYYYYAVAGSNQIVAYATMQNRLNTIAPSAVASSLVAGNTCDYGTTKIYNGDTYLLLHHGLFNAETNGTYTFGLSSDDGSTLFIDGALIVDNNKDQGWVATPQKTGTVFLTQGLHEVMMGMYENAGGQGLTLFCQTPGQGSLTALPNSLLLPDATRVTQLSGTGKIEAIGTTNVTPFEVVANTASTFSGTIVATQGIYIVKSGVAKQTLALTANCPTSTVFSVRSGELEFSLQPNRGEVMVSSGATASLTVATGSGTVSGISGAGTYALNNALAQEFLNDLTNRTFSGSLQGVSGSRLSKIGPATWTLTGNSSAFAGTLIVTNGVLDLAGTASLGGSISNSAAVTLNVTEDRTFTMSAGGKGALVKNEASTVTLKLNGAAFEQQLTINAGTVLFDNQGNDVVMTKQPVINGTGSWGVVSAGKITLAATNAVVAVATIKIDTGTLGLGTANPVQDGLISQIDATALSTLTLSGTNVIRWNSLVAGQAYTNAGVINAPYFDPAAFGGRGGVVFGAPNTETHLQSVLNQVGKTVIVVARFTATQPGLGGFWGQTGQDKGIRAVGGMTAYQNPGDGNDYVQNGGKTFTNGFEMTTQTNLGTTPHIASFYAGNNGTWAGSISTTIGCYWYSAQPTRFVKAEIGEMIVYNRVITDAERLQIEQYLRLKWTDVNATIVNYLPEGASLSLTNNGTLNLGKTTQTFGSITGSGTITNGYAIVRDDIRPGGDGVIGTLRFAGFEQQTATYYADLSQNIGAPCDQVVISGTGPVSLDGLTVNINPLTLPGAITRFKVMSTLGTFTGAPTLTAATSYWTAVIGDSGKSLYLIYSSGTLILFK